MTTGIKSPNANSQKLTPLTSVPNLITSSIPNSLYGSMPLFGTPQLFGNNSGGTPSARLNLNGHVPTTPNRIQTPNALFNSSIPNSNGFVYTMPGFTSPNGQQQQQLYTPTGAENMSQNVNLSNDQNSGWGLANNGLNNGAIPTQQATNFMQSSFANYSKN